MRAQSLLLVVGACIAHAQFYSPDTEYHDIAQRMFPVEAARILAWQHGASEVKFSVETTEAHETVWEITWIKEANTVRSRTIRYPEKLLVSGPQYYREVFAQLAGDDWRPASAPPDNAAAAYWQGAELAGMSRLEAIRAADQLFKEKKKIATPAHATRLAGILSHGALPSFAMPVMLDGVLVSRAAAWLCLAETMRREPLDAPWCVIDAIAGREKAAAARWTEIPAKAPEKQKAVERFWSTFLKKPSAMEAFLFAALPENRAYSVPMLAALSRVDYRWAEVTVDTIDGLAGEALFRRSYDYLPVIMAKGNVGGGHVGRVGPNLLLAAWEQTLRDVAPDDQGTGYRELFAKLPAKAGGEDDPDDFSHVKRLGPILSLGLDAGGSPLTAVAHFSTRDLLDYGWEAVSMQYGYAHRFLAKSFGDQEAADRLSGAVFEALPGSEAFFGKATDRAATRIPDPLRLEFNGSSFTQTTVMAQVLKLWPDRPIHWLRRTWLSRGDNPSAWRAALNGPNAGRRPADSPSTDNRQPRLPASNPDLEKDLQRLAKEGGSLAFADLLSDTDKRLQNATFRARVREKLIADCPWAIAPRILKAWRTDGANGQNVFGYAQALEKLTWECCTPIEDYAIFLAYLQTNAIPSAKRYYDQIVPFITETVGFSNTTGPMRFALAWWEGDETAMRRALRDSGTYSFSDLNLQTNFAIIQGDLEKAAELLDATVERYPSNKEILGAIKAYLPLIPALKDPNHPDRGRALDGFPKHRYWNWTQWILAKQAKLSDEETIRFLGGDQALEESHAFMVAYVRKDKDAFEKLFTKLRWNSYRCTGVFMALMRNDLLQIAPPAEQADLKPADARPLADLMREAVNAAEAAQVSSAMDFSKYKSADELWAAIGKLRETPREMPDSPEDQMRRVREWLMRQRTAAGAFVAAHSSDPRRHDARMLQIDTGFQLLRMGDQTIKPPSASELEAIRDASDASDSARGEAAFFLLWLDAGQLDLSSRHTIPPFHKKLSEFIERHPKHRRTREAASMQMQLLQLVDTPGAENLLKKLSEQSDEAIAGRARAMLKHRAMVADLKTKPLELKFTAADGREIDAAKLRGKVVLLDFWASWCGPCIADAPNVVAAYEKYRDRGFEILGINLDQDKGSMESAAKRLSMNWPHHYDGRGWENELVQRFGVRSIPSTWLFDQEGKLRNVGLRGAELGAAIERILRGE